MNHYIKNIIVRKDVIKEIQNIIGDKFIHVGYSDGKLRELEIDDKGISASKKKELQNYVDTLEK